MENEFHVHGECEKASAPPMIAAVFFAVDAARYRWNIRNTVIEMTPKTAAKVRFSQYV
jgi:hypothetical protein